MRRRRPSRRRSSAWCGDAQPSRAEALSGEHGVGVLLISAYTESEFAELIADSPALGFISKTDLSASRVTAMLDRHPKG
jgi:hypothetical protein